MPQINAEKRRFRVRCKAFRGRQRRFMICASAWICGGELNSLLENLFRHAELFGLRRALERFMICDPRLYTKLGLDCR